MIRRQLSSRTTLDFPLAEGPMMTRTGRAATNSMHRDVRTSGIQRYPDYPPFRPWGLLECQRRARMRSRASKDSLSAASSRRNRSRARGMSPARSYRSARAYHSRK